MLDSEVYNEAVNLIEKGWTQNAFARNSLGRMVSPCEDEAKSWCLTGALVAAVNNLREGSTYTATNARKVLELTNNLGLANNDEVQWNDDPDRTKEQVVRLLQKAATLSYISEGKQNEIQYNLQ